MTLSNGFFLHNDIEMSRGVTFSSRLIYGARCGFSYYEKVPAAAAGQLYLGGEVNSIGLTIPCLVGFLKQQIFKIVM